MGIGGVWQWVVICVILTLIVLPIFYSKKKKRERLPSENVNDGKLGEQWARIPHSENFPEFVKSLWRGDVPLPITFWVFGVVVRSIVIGMYIHITGFDPDTASGSAVLFSILLMGPYELFTIVSIWRSATKYEGNAIWSFWAKFLMVIEFLQSIVVLFFGFVIYLF